MEKYQKHHRAKLLKNIQCHQKHSIMADTKQTLLTMFNHIPDFKYGLLSMLSPSHLYVLLPTLGYKLSERERERYMSLDREILKSTAYIDRLLKQGYSVTLVSTNLRELYQVIRGKTVGDDSWNYNPFQWGRTEEDPNRWPRDDWYPWYRIKVMICITHPRDLAFDEAGDTITRNTDIPVPLPGTWKRLTSRGEESRVLDEPTQGEAPADYYINRISGAKLRTDYTYQLWEHYKGWKGVWNVCTDIAEDCAEICFFQPERQEGKHTLLHCQDHFDEDSVLRFLDSNILREGAFDYFIDYVGLHRNPLELKTQWAYWLGQKERSKDPRARRGLKDLKLVNDSGERLHYLIVTYLPHVDYGEIISKIPI